MRPCLPPVGRAHHEPKQYCSFLAHVLGAPASLIGSEFLRYSHCRAPTLRLAPSRCPKPSSIPVFVAAYTNNDTRRHEQPSLEAPGPIGVRLCAIHPSAWKGYSAKFGCTMLHISGPIGSETANRPGPAPGANPYMFWCRIKMHCSEWEAVRTTPRMWECAGHKSSHQFQY